jgi:hypothetical protein
MADQIEPRIDRRGDVTDGVDRIDVRALGERARDSGCTQGSRKKQCFCSHVTILFCVSVCAPNIPEGDMGVNFFFKFFLNGGAAASTSARRALKPFKSNRLAGSGRRARMAFPAFKKPLVFLRQAPCQDRSLTGLAQ